MNEDKPNPESPEGEDIPTPESPPRDSARTESAGETGSDGNTDARAREAAEELIDSVKRAFRSTCEDAKDAVDRAIPAAKDDFSKGLRDLAYGIAYAGAFGSALVREWTPDSVQDGFAEGREDGRDAAEAFVRKRRTKAEEPTPAGGDGAPNAPGPA